jgi:hypothetical protein
VTPETTQRCLNGHSVSSEKSNYYYKSLIFNLQGCNDKIR